MYKSSHPFSKVCNGNVLSCPSHVGNARQSHGGFHFTPVIHPMTVVMKGTRTVTTLMRLWEVGTFSTLLVRTESSTATLKDGWAVAQEVEPKLST